MMSPLRASHARDLSQEVNGPLHISLFE